MFFPLLLSIFLADLTLADPVSVPCGPGFIGFAQSPAALRELPALDDLVRNSGLIDEVDLLRSSARAVVDAKEFLPMRKNLGPGYLLAVDGINFTAEIFSGKKGLKHWSGGYSEFNIYRKMKGHTAAFLSKAVATGKPIVFLVPPNLMSRPSFTQNEMLWFLEDPERMKNVTFVFGAYDLFPEEVLQRFNRSRDRAEIQRLLAD